MGQDVASSILQALASVGVKQIFGIPGDAINGLVDGIRRQDVIEFVTVRHEESGAFAASAQAKLSGTLGVVAGTAGPGAIHLLNGLYDAKLDGAPVLAITGQVATDQIGTHAHQEVDLASLFKDVAVFSSTIVNPDQMPAVVRAAIRTAVSEGGVSHLNLPSDIALQIVKRTDDSPILPPQTKAIPCDTDLAKAARILNAASAPTILVGIGARSAVDEVLEIATTLQAPIIKTLRAKSLIPDDHPQLLGGIGLLGTSPAVQAMEASDALFMIGTDFPYSDFLPDEAAAIQLDIDPRVIGRRTTVEVGLVGDAGQTLRALGPLLKARVDGVHLEQAQDEMTRWRGSQLAAEADDAIPIRPQRVAAEISSKSAPGTIYVCDTGAVTVWAARHLRMKPGDHFTISGGLASMAYGMSGAIGAKLAFPESNVVALVGDGGFSMLMGDLLTAVEHDLDLTIVIFNNSKLGLIQMEQEAEGLPEFATRLQNPDFAEVARSMGGSGWRVEDPASLGSALAEAMSHHGPSVVDVIVNPEEITMPPKVEAEFAWGYVRAKLKEVAGKGAQDGGFAPLKELISRAWT